MFEVRLSTTALCQLLTHCAATGDQLLCSLTLYEEDEEGLGEGVVTRSQKAQCKTPLQRSKVSLPVKIVRLLVSDLRSHLEEEEESGSEGSGEDGVGGMEALLQAEEPRLEPEESEDDPDFHDDPLLQLDMRVSVWAGLLLVCAVVIVTHTQTYLVQYLKELCQLPFFTSTIKPHLRAHETHILQTAGVYLN